MVLMVVSAALPVEVVVLLSGLEPSPTTSVAERGKNFVAGTITNRVFISTTGMVVIIVSITQVIVNINDWRSSKRLKN